MRELIEGLMTNPSLKKLVVMPLTRLLFYEPFAINGFHFFRLERLPRRYCVQFLTRLSIVSEEEQI